MMKLTIIAFLVTSVSSQLQVSRPGIAPNAFAKNVYPGMTNYASSRNVNSFATGSSGEPSPAQYSYKSQEYKSPQPNLDRRSMGALLTAGALGAVSQTPALAAGTIPLATFDGTFETTRLWTIVPGLRYLKYNAGKLGIKGKVSDPKYGTKDEIIAYSLPNFQKDWADISGCKGISLQAKTNNPYDGYEISIGQDPSSQSPRSYLYKAKFDAPLEQFGNVEIPFTSFKSKTGQSPDSTTLKEIGRMSFWMSAGGEPSLEVTDVSGYGCGAAMLVEQEDEDSTSVLWYFAPAPLGLLAFFIMRSRVRPSVTVPTALLG
jgi:hypothetical protein